TSVRQIADAVGCTEAALYYHFKEGKRALLGAVVEAYMPTLNTLTSRCQAATSLYDLVERFGSGIIEEALYPNVSRLRWLIVEFPTLNADERATIYERSARFRQTLTDFIRAFVETDAEAERLAWILAFVMFGYGQMMINMEMASVFPFDTRAFVEDLAARLSGSHLGEVGCACDDHD
ncbi:MAG: TetR/AcrR family transcriptional regulator, partial [Chloroflexi bacterium]|nr:TetR/AcrR family transcriptional regulator [Chloroflexota bacterium]